uniref:Uncharacterized protein n=1 Tax=viral metagenome TaxID=1070528 RepID=A0A6C0B364_9ZZZZ
MGTRRRTKHHKRRYRGGEETSFTRTKGMVQRALGLDKKPEEPQFRAPGSAEDMYRLDPERGREQQEAERRAELSSFEKKVNKRVAAVTGRHGLPFTPRPFRDKFDGEEDDKYQKLKEKHEKKEEARFNSWQKAKMERVEKGLPSSVAGRRKSRRRR